MTPDESTLFYSSSADVFVRGMRLSDGVFTFERALTDGPGKWPAIVLSADGRQVFGAVTDDDHKLIARVWDAATGVQLRTLRGCQGQIEGLAFHPLSADVIATSPDTRSWSLAGRLPAWEMAGSPRASVFLGTDDFFTATGVPAQLKEPSRWDDRIAPLPADFTGPLFAAARHEHAVIGAYGSYGNKGLGAEYLLALPTEGSLKFKPGKLLERTLPSVRLRPSPDGKRVAACDEYSGLSLHDVQTGSLLSTNNPAAGLRKLVAFDWLTPNRLIGFGCTGPRGEASNEEQLFLSDADTGQALQRVTHSSPMDCLVILPGGTEFAEAGVDKRVRIRDAATMKVRREFRAHDGPITALATHPSQPLLATASADLSIRIWNLAENKMVEELPRSAAVPQTVEFSPTGNRLASVDQRGRVRIWDFSQHVAGSAQAAAK